MATGWAEELEKCFTSIMQWLKLKLNFKRSRIILQYLSEKSKLDIFPKSISHAP